MFERPDQNTERHVQFRQQYLDDVSYGCMKSLVQISQIGQQQVKQHHLLASITHWISVNFLLIKNKKMEKQKIQL